MKKKGKNKKLKAVSITKGETCKTYALKRIGRGHLLSMESDGPKIESLAFGGLFKQVSKPKKGALLLWVEKDEYWDNGGGKIDEAGRVVGVDKKIYGHLAVYEGSGLYSEVVKGHHFPELRLGELKEAKAPDYILELID